MKTVVNKAYKYRLYPNKEQTILLHKHFGCVRYIYNWALDLKNKSYKQNNTNLNKFELTNMLPQLKNNEETKWLKEVNSLSLQYSIRNLDVAFTNFFKKRGGFQSSNLNTIIISHLQFLKIQ